MAEAPLPGRATAAATRAFAARVGPRVVRDHFREPRGSGLALSSIGIGTYLGAPDDATDALYREALLEAFALGANVVDAAVSYRAQRSERTIGRAIREAIRSGLLKRREEIVVATKGGFVPFDSTRPKDPDAWIRDTYVRPGIVLPGDLVAGCHSIAPGYLRDQIARSRSNLGLETIDVYFLHNPETQLEEVPRAEFLDRLRRAFETLEAACDAGHLAAYGTATWGGYRAPKSAREHLSLSEHLAIARGLRGDGHRFRFVELPFNASMTEARDLANQEGPGGRAVPFLEAAAAAGIHVFTSASIDQARLARKGGAKGRTGAQAALEFVRTAAGVGTALVGMKSAAHVRENLAVVRP